MPAKTPVRIALIGCGATAPALSNRLHHFPGNVRSSPGGDIVPEKAGAMKRRFGPEQAAVANRTEKLPDLDFDQASVCTPAGDNMAGIGCQWTGADAAAGVGGTLSCGGRLDAGRRPAA